MVFKTHSPFGDSPRRPAAKYDGEDRGMVVTAKGSERYVFLFDVASSFQAMQTATRFAADPELSLSEFDALGISRQIFRWLERQLRRARDAEEMTG